MCQALPSYFGVLVFTNTVEREVVVSLRAGQGLVRWCILQQTDGSLDFGYIPILWANGFVEAVSRTSTTDRLVGTQAALPRHLHWYIEKSWKKMRWAYIEQPPFSL